MKVTDYIRNTIDRLPSFLKSKPIQKVNWSGIKPSTEILDEMGQFPQKHYPLHLRGVDDYENKKGKRKT